MIYYDTATRTMTSTESATTVPSDDERVAAFFAPLPAGKMLDYDIDGFPLIVDIPPLTPEQLLQQASLEINNAIQNHLDSKAQEFRYDNMMSARSYTGYTNPFQAEAQELAVWASECWVTAGQIEADVLSGTRPMPTADEVLAELPIYGA